MRPLCFAWLLAAASGLGEPGALPDDAAALLQQQVSAHSAADEPPPEQRHRPVMWVHVHKSGGTGMCKLAKANHEKFMGGATPEECNLFPSDDWRFWTPVRRPDCTDHRMRWLASGFTWASMERPFLNEDYCPDQFLYATMIRHPVTLARSMVNYLDGHMKTWNGWMWPQILSCLEGRQAGHKASCVASMEFPPMVGAHWVFFDNFMVRLFGGLDVWNVPAGSINATHRQLALDRLNSFDLVLTLEQFSSNQTRSTLARMFGWSDFAMIDANHKHTGLKLTEFGDEDIKRIERVNAHDMLLYNTFKEREVARR